MDTLSSPRNGNKHLEEYDLSQLLKGWLAQTQSRKGIVICTLNEEAWCLASIGVTVPDEYLDPLDGSPFERVLRTHSPYIHNSTLTLPILGLVTNFLCWPVLRQKKLVGLIALAEKNDPYSLSNLPDLRIAEILLHEEVLRRQMERYHVDDRLLKTKDLFLASMSHEIRTPLNGIVGYIQLLSQTETTDPQRRYLNSMNQCALSLVQIINDILDYAKLASGKARLKKEVVRVEEIFEAVNNALTNEIQKKKHRVTTKVLGEIPERIRVDRTKVVQILINLLSNAVKFTPPEGSIEMTVQRNDHHLLFAVKDSGIGISREDQRRLFTAFTQIESSFNQVYEGSGLGLAIAKMLTKLMEGTIGVESTPGSGSTFSFSVRFEDSEPPTEKKLSPFHHQRVVIVSNDSVLRLFLNETLIEWGVASIPISIREANSILRSGLYQYHLIIVDLSQEIDEVLELAKFSKGSRPLLPILGLSPAGAVTSPYLDEVLTDYESRSRLHEKLLSLFQRQVSEKERPLPTQTRILVAEDISYNQEIISSMLRSLGFEDYFVVGDGVQAIRELHKGEYDLLLLDLKMPRLNGYQVLDYMKEHNLRTKVIPLSASVFEEDLNKCRSYGIETFLKKPLDLRSLREAMSQLTSPRGNSGEAQSQE